jgi:O-antigen biosynthesis protein WbqP
LHNFYRRYGKRLLDIILGILGCIPACPVMLIVIIAMFFFDRGTIFFVQERAGKRDANGNPTTFRMHKFRTMKMCTPHDVPTHQLQNPEQYITSVGKLLRKTSLDELPQIFQIFTGKMSVIGPRPALWNQFDLIAERDKYGANDIRPGLTGWAQINGRDELPIDVKAKLDGEYAQNLSFAFDCRCFFGSITAVLKHKGVVEGGTGAMDKEHQA